MFNAFPGKLSETPTVNIMVSSDYGWADYFWGTEFDDAASARQPEEPSLSVMFTGAGGMAAMLFVDGAGLGIAQLIETGAGAFAELFWQRIAEL